MAKRNYSWTEEKIAKYLKEGRGSGELSHYKPWLNIHNVPSHGNSTRIKGWTTQRSHHFFSNIEKNYFYLLDWSEAVLDIREQFPLDRKDTIEIADEKSIQHIKDDVTETYIPMTTDFLVTMKRKNKVIVVARSIKPVNMLEDERTLEKLEVERAYWEAKDIEWGIVTDKDIPKEFAKNIQWIHPFRKLENQEEEILAQKFLDYIIWRKTTNTISLFNAIIEFEEHFILNPGVGIKYLRYLIANKLIKFDLNQKMNLRSLLIDDLSCYNTGGDISETTGYSS
jgi:hypothetical protein